MSDDQPVKDTESPTATALKVYIESYIETLADQARQPSNTLRFYAESYLNGLSAVETKGLLYRILTGDDDPDLNTICSEEEWADAEVRARTEALAMLEQDGGHVG